MFRVSKAVYVDKLSELLQLADIDVVKAEYKFINGCDIIVITFSNGYEKQINVNMDSHYAMLIDLTKQLFV